MQRLIFIFLLFPFFSFSQTNHFEKPDTLFNEKGESFKVVFRDYQISESCNIGVVAQVSIDSLPDLKETGPLPKCLRVTLYYFKNEEIYFVREVDWQEFNLWFHGK